MYQWQGGREVHSWFYKSEKVIQQATNPTEKNANKGETMLCLS